MEYKKYIQQKSDRREKKRQDRRAATPEEVVFIFEKILEGWKTIKIYNEIIQKNNQSQVCKKHVERISTGNCKIYENETNKETYQKYIELRQKVYDFHLKIKMKKKEDKNISVDL